MREASSPFSVVQKDLEKKRKRRRQREGEKGDAHTFIKKERRGERKREEKRRE